MAALVLGGIVFKHFEIPERIVFPRRQRHHIHYHVGSERVVDATGPDPLPIRWSGRFTGPDAAPRVRTLINMTDAGVALQLVYGSFMDRVLITEFTPDLEKIYDIRYTIECLPTEARGAYTATLGALQSTSAMVGVDLSALANMTDAAKKIAEQEAP